MLLSFKLLSACSDWVEKCQLNLFSFDVFTLIVLLNSVLCSNMLLAKGRAPLATSTFPSQNLMGQVYIVEYVPAEFLSLSVEDPDVQAMQPAIVRTSF